MSSALFSGAHHLLRSEQGVDWHVHFDGDDVHIGAQQDCTDIIDANKRSQNSGQTGWNGDKSMRRAASIPVVIQLEWMTKYGVDLHNPDHAAGVRRLLNSSDYRYLRTHEWII